jgi:hypothetical protein
LLLIITAPSKAGRGIRPLYGMGGEIDNWHRGEAGVNWSLPNWCVN